MGVSTTNKIQQRIDRMVFVSALFSLLYRGGSKKINIFNLEQATIFTTDLYLRFIQLDRARTSKYWELSEYSNICTISIDYAATVVFFGSNLF